MTTHHPDATVRRPLPRPVLSTARYGRPHPGRYPVYGLPAPQLPARHAGHGPTSSADPPLPAADAPREQPPRIAPAAPAERVDGLGTSPTTRETDENGRPQPGRGCGRRARPRARRVPASLGTALAITARPRRYPTSRPGERIEHLPAVSTDRATAVDESAAERSTAPPVWCAEHGRRRHREGGRSLRRSTSGDSAEDARRRRARQGVVFASAWGVARRVRWPAFRRTLSAPPDPDDVALRTPDIAAGSRDPARRDLPASRPQGRDRPRLSRDRRWCRPARWSWAGSPTSDPCVTRSVTRTCEKAAHPAGERPSGGGGAIWT